MILGGCGGENGSNGLSRVCGDDPLDCAGWSKKDKFVPRMRG